jgi:antitoxin component YwqK of YwqJK toxin-antitoxin module
MKVYTLTGLFLLICSCTRTNQQNKEEAGQTSSTVSLLKTSGSITTQQDFVLVNNKKFTGTLYLLQSNNRDTLLIEQFKNGLLSGLTRKWFNNGAVMELRNYKTGKKNGRQTVFWENGHKKFEFTALDDAPEGEMKEWSMDGRLIHLANYRNGQEEGTQQLWYDNGKIRANYVIRNGRRYGLLGTKNCRNVSDSLPDFK